MNSEPLTPTPAEPANRQPVTLVTVYGDEQGGILAVEYPAEPLSAEQAGAVLANVLKDTLGEAPNMQDVMTIQRSIMAAVQGK